MEIMVTCTVCGKQHRLINAKQVNSQGDDIKFICRICLDELERKGWEIK